MIKCNEIVSDVEKYYDTIRSTRDFYLSVETEKLLQIPSYYNITKELSEAVFDYNKAVYSGEDETAYKLYEKVEALKKKRDDFEEKHGVIRDSFKCKLCKDTGYQGSRRCVCFFDNVTKKCYEELGVSPPRLHGFDEDTLSTKNGLSSTYAKLKVYAENFRIGSKNLIITGKTGTGKSFLAEAIAKKVAENKNVALFLSSVTLNEIAIDNIRSSSPSARIDDRILQTCDLLVIDDLGSEKLLNKITVENLYTLISARLINQKPFIITTNFTMDELLIRYGDRLFSRLTGKNTVTLTLNGKDLRKA